MIQEKSPRFWTNLPELIRDAGYTQLEVCDGLDVPRSTLTAYCAGKHMIPHEVRAQLASFLGYTDANTVKCIRASDRANPLLEVLAPRKGLSDSTDTWLTLKCQTIEWLVQQWAGRACSCIELQKFIDLELQMVDQVRWLVPQKEYTVSRRKVLQALALLPLTSAPGFSRFVLAKRHPEELLPACAASIACCWRLLNDTDTFASIEQAITAYLPTLIAWSQDISKYQRSAASLAAQACLLLDLVSYHRFCFSQSLAYANQAVDFAKKAHDPDLLGYSLLLAGGAANLLQQRETMLQRHQESALGLKELIQPLQSYVLSQLAFSYAQNGDVSSAQYTLQAAEQAFPPVFGEVPVFIAADYDQSQLVIFQGLTYLALTETDPDHALEHGRKAVHSLAKTASLSAEIVLPARLQCEIVQLRLQAAIVMGNLDEALPLFYEGYQGALNLGSEKRWHELQDNIRRAQKRWKGEKQVDAFAAFMQAK